jgi:hypothetical protein
VAGFEGGHHALGVARARARDRLAALVHDAHAPIRRGGRRGLGGRPLGFRSRVGVARPGVLLGAEAGEAPALLGLAALLLTLAGAFAPALLASRSPPRSASARSAPPSLSPLGGGL